MPPITKNLGFIKAIHEGTSAPSNVKMLWYDTSVGVNFIKYYDTIFNIWKPLASNGQNNVVKITNVTNVGNNFTSSSGITSWSYNAVYLFTPSDQPNGATTLKEGSLPIINIVKVGTSVPEQIEDFDLNPNNIYVLAWNGDSLIVTNINNGGSQLFTSDIVVSLPPGVNLGPWVNGQTIPMAGKTMQEGIELLAISTLYPTLTNPNVGITLSGTGFSSLVEVGATITNFVANAIFNRGSINPQYTATSPFRSGLPSLYIYTGKISESNSSSSLTNSSTPVSVVVTLGTNTVNIQTNYGIGVQPKDSVGGNFGSPLAAGSSSNFATFTGIYPYFYGKVASGGAPAGSNRPTINQALIDSGIKIIADSNGTITINFGSTSDDYIWFAIPTTSTSKTVWYVDALNNGSIGGSVTPGGNLFPNLQSLSVTTVLWSGISYKVYLANYQSAVGSIQLRNL